MSFYYAAVSNFLPASGVLVSEGFVSAGFTSSVFLSSAFLFVN